MGCETFSSTVDAVATKNWLKKASDTLIGIKLDDEFKLRVATRLIDKSAIIWWDLDVILDKDWLSTHQASVDCFTKKVLFQKLGFPELEFEGDRRVLSTYAISALLAKRLLQKGCKVYLAHFNFGSGLR